MNQNERLMDQNGHKLFIIKLLQDTQIHTKFAIGI